MSRSYKRDRKGRFAKYSTQNVTKSKTIRRKGKAVATVTVTDNARNRHIRRRHAAVGAAIGTLVLPGVGTAVGARAGLDRANRKGHGRKIKVTTYSSR